MKERLVGCLRRGVKGGVKSAWWITKMMVPITALVALLKWLGVIDLLSKWLSPVFEVMGLGGEAVVVFLTNALTALYSGIAVIATLDLDFRQATILAVMGLICHNLIIETMIQKRAGANAVGIVALRVGLALVAGVALNWLLPLDYSGVIDVETQVEATGLAAIAEQWAWSLIKLIPMIFALVAALNILQQLLREFGWAEWLTKPLKPLMKVLGLKQEVSFLWVVLNTLGLAYGGGVLIAELETGQIDPREASLLNTSAAVTHSLLEDTLIFAAIGLSVWWLILPRLVLAIGAVWVQKLYYKMGRGTWDVAQKTNR